MKFPKQKPTRGVTTLVGFNDNSKSCDVSNVIHVKNGLLIHLGCPEQWPGLPKNLPQLCKYVSYTERKNSINTLIKNEYYRDSQTEMCLLLQ